MNRENELILVDYNQKFEEELNCWIEKETAQGINLIRRFLCDDMPLGCFVEKIISMLDISFKIAVKDNCVVGLVGYCLNDLESAHVEMVVVNPDFRGFGYSKQILQNLKSEIKKEKGISKLTLSVNKNNIHALNTFSEIANKTKKYSTSIFVGFEI